MVRWASVNFGRLEGVRYLRRKAAQSECKAWVPTLSAQGEAHGVAIRQQLFFGKGFHVHGRQNQVCRAH